MYILNKMIILITKKKILINKKYNKLLIYRIAKFRKKWTYQRKIWIIFHNSCYKEGNKSINLDRCH